MIRYSQARTRLFVLGIMACGSSTVAYGQGNTFNPYGNSGYADYREFTTPMYSNDPSLPGQARLQSGFYGSGATGTRSNQFEAYSNSLESGASDAAGSGRGSVSGVPYYRANRLYDKDDRRAYRPNAASDREYQARVAKRNADYNKALAEKDPRKRAQMIQKIERDALDQPASSVPRAGTQPRTAKSATARVEPAPGRRATAPTAPTTASRAVTPSAASPAPAPAGTRSSPEATTVPPVSSPATVPMPAPR